MASEQHMNDAELLDLAERVFDNVKPLSPEAKARVAERSKHLLPGEDLLHYDVDRLYPPPEAPPSEMVEQVVQPVSKARGPKTRPGSRGAAKRQNGKTVPAAVEPLVQVRVLKKAAGPATVQMPMKAFVAGTGEQEEAVRERRVRKRQLRRGVMVVVALLAMGGMAMAWAYVDKGDDVKPAGPGGEPTAAGEVVAAPTAPAAVVTAVATPPVAAPTGTAAVTVRPVETAAVPSAPSNIRPTRPMKVNLKPSFVPPPIAPTVTAEPTAEPIVAPPPEPAPAPTPTNTAHLPGGGRW